MDIIDEAEVLTLVKYRDVQAIFYKPSKRNSFNIFSAT